MRPTPVWNATLGQWQVDLRRPWDLGRHVLAAAPRERAAVVEATHAAYELLAALRATAAPSPQLSLPVDGRTVGQAVAQYLEERAYRRSREWHVNTGALVVRELGHLPLADLVPPVGTRMLWAWRDEVRGRGRDGAPGRPVGARAMLDRIQILRMALRWAAEPPRLWLPYLPPFPDPRIDEREPLHRALDRWVDEATFRIVRSAIFASGFAMGGLISHWRAVGLPWPECTPDDYVARRRLWMSFGLYTGMRHEDLDLLDDKSACLASGLYWPRGRKTGYEGGGEEMPDQLRADLECERDRLGRPYRPGELIAGGPWPHAARVIRVACEAAGVPVFGPMDLRRSFAFLKCAAGQTEEQIRRLMCHRDSRMIRQVYLRALRPASGDGAGRAWPEMRTRTPGAGGARVVPITLGVASGGGQSAPRRDAIAPILSAGKRGRLRDSGG